MRIATFTVSGIPPSPNRTHGRAWQAMSREVEEWRARAGIAIHDALVHHTWDGRPFKRARVTFRFVYRDRRVRDPDNAMASCKRLWDMFRPTPLQKRYGSAPYVFWEDDWTHIPQVVVEYGGIDRERPRVDIEVVEIEDPDEKGAAAMSD